MYLMISRLFILLEENGIDTGSNLGQQFEEFYHMFREYFTRQSMMLSAIRAIGWFVVKLLRSLAEMLNDGLTAMYKVLSFEKYLEGTGFYDTYKSLVQPLMIISLVIVGILFIVGSEKVKMSKLLQNIGLSIMVIFTLPAIIGTLTNVTETWYGMEGQNTENSLDWIAIEHTYDLAYIFQDENYATRLENNQLNPFVAGEATAEDIWYINITEVVFPKSELSPFKKTYSIGGESVFSHYMVQGDATIQTIDLGWMDIYKSFPNLSTWYYRYSYDGGVIILCYVAYILVAAFTIFRSAKLAYEIVVGHLVALFAAALDLATGDKLKQALFHIFSTFLVMMYCVTALVIFNRFLGWIFGRDSGLEGVGWLVRAVVAIAVGFGVIDGPKLIQKILGIDAGVQDGYNMFDRMLLFSSRMGRKLVAAGKGAAGALGKTAQNGEDQKEKEARRDGVNKGPGDDGNNAGQNKQRGKKNTSNSGRNASSGSGKGSGSSDRQAHQAMQIPGSKSSDAQSDSRKTGQTGNGSDVKDKKGTDVLAAESGAVQTGQKAGDLTSRLLAHTAMSAPSDSSRDRNAEISTNTDQGVSSQKSGEKKENNPASAGNGAKTDGSSESLDRAGDTRGADKKDGQDSTMASREIGEGGRSGEKQRGGDSSPIDEKPDKADSNVSRGESGKSSSQNIQDSVSASQEADKTEQTSHPSGTSEERKLSGESAGKAEGNLQPDAQAKDHEIKADIGAERDGSLKPGRHEAAGTGTASGEASAVSASIEDGPNPRNQDDSGQPSTKSASEESGASSPAAEHRHTGTSAEPSSAAASSPSTGSVTHAALEEYSAGETYQSAKVVEASSSRSLRPTTLQRTVAALPSGTNTVTQITYSNVEGQETTVSVPYTVGSSQTYFAAISEATIKYFATEEGKAFSRGRVVQKVELLKEVLKGKKEES